MKITRNNLMILLSSFLYAVQFYINNKITPVGDQTAFLNYAKEFHYNYLFFGIDRYFTWSSRLLIESATLFFSVHEKIFVLAAFAATVLLLIAAVKLLPSLPWLPGLLIFLFFPAAEFLSAGSIPTYTNYIFPASFLLFALLQKDSQNSWVRIASIFFFAFAVMQEQLAVFAFLWLAYQLLYKREQVLHNAFYLGLSFLGILSARLSPGNSLRLTKEVATWFPNFSNLNLFQKVGLGFLETGDKMLTVSFPFVIVFLLVLLVYSIQRKNILSVVLNSFVLLHIFFQKMSYNTIFLSLAEISKLARESGTFSFNLTYLGGLVFYGLLLLMIVYSLWLAVANRQEKIWLVYLFLIGFASRMLISLSPTLYASSTRTFLPLMMSLFIITCRLLQAIYSQYREGKEAEKGVFAKQTMKRKD